VQATASAPPPPPLTEELTEEEAMARATEEWMAGVEEWARRMSGENWAIAGALVALVHVLSLLLPHWSTTLDFFLTCYTVRALECSNRVRVCVCVCTRECLCMKR
jgi:hypothetical protein